MLWHLEIEARRVPEVADLFHTTPAAISSRDKRVAPSHVVTRENTLVASMSCAGPPRW